MGVERLDCKYVAGIVPVEERCKCQAADAAAAPAKEKSALKRLCPGRPDPTRVRGTQKKVFSGWDLILEEFVL